MRPLTEAWIAAARMRRKFGKPPADEWHARRERWIAEHAAGRSFVDIGGLFNDGANAFRAEDAGASAVTIFDVGDIEFAFDYAAEHERRGSKIRYVQGDLHDDVSIEQVGAHDLVWCTGVLYHTPNPVHQLMQLREITRELLFLGTHTIPEVPGVPQACLYYPYLPEDARTALARAHWNSRGLPRASGRRSTSGRCSATRTSGGGSRHRRCARCCHRAVRGGRGAAAALFALVRRPGRPARRRGPADAGRHVRPGAPRGARPRRRPAPLRGVLRPLPVAWPPDELAGARECRLR